MEWEIAHRPGALSPAANEVLTTAFRRDAHVVMKRPGEPVVVDEDIAGTLVARARLEPEDCFGITRMLNLRATDFGDGTSMGAYVEGVLLFTRALPAVGAAQQQLLRRRRSPGCRRTRSTSRSWTGRRSPPGSRPTAGARRASRRRSRTSRARGASC